ncbi:MAG TPA: hypothetical protein VJ183_05460 [Chloroflexia bacterium]|nr:hypothetical protein [Chloroflexia bacterium]
MQDSQTHEQDQPRTRHQANHFETQPEHHAGDELSATPELALPYSSSLLHDRRLSMRGNAPIRARVMQKAQQTHGNRAVQRAIQPHMGAARSARLPVQRMMFSGIGGNSNPTDWMKIPGPIGPVPVPYPNMLGGGGGGAGGGGGMFDGLGGMLREGGGGLAQMMDPMGMLGGLGGMLGGIGMGGLGGMLGGLGGMLGGGGGGGPRPVPSPAFPSLPGPGGGFHPMPFPSIPGVGGGFGPGPFPSIPGVGLYPVPSSLTGGALIGW